MGNNQIYAVKNTIDPGLYRQYKNHDNTATYNHPNKEINVPAFTEV